MRNAANRADDLAWDNVRARQVLDTIIEANSEPASRVPGYRKTGGGGGHKLAAAGQKSVSALIAGALMGYSRIGADRASTL
jgi:hypothetical protein